MEIEKVKEIKDKLQEEIFIANSFGDKLRKVPTKELENLLTYINELESEKENLYNLNQNLISDKQVLMSENELLRNAKVVYETVDYCYEDLKKAEKRIAKLEKENAKYKQKLTTNQWVQEIRKEALKQFAERLKEKMYENENGYIEFLSGKNAVAVDIVDFENCLDETLKEFIYS